MQILKASLFLVFIGLANMASAQKYFSKTGNISFSSATAVENIEAISNSASTVFDVASGKIQWAVLIKSFEFEKALMQEHFNENYMESSTFPKSKFTGVLEDIQSIDLTKDGTYTVNAVGKLTIHGVTQEVTAPATFEVMNGKVKATSTLKVLIADYGIKIPAVVASNIAKEIEIKIIADYELL